MNQNETINFLEAIEHQIELLQDCDLTHSEKRGACALIGLEMADLKLYVEDREYECLREKDCRAHHLKVLLKEAQQLLMTCDKKLKHKDHNKAVEACLVQAFKKISEVNNKLTTSPDESDIPF